MPHHDIAVIGSGSGNSLVTKELADRDFAIIESGTFGGTCINVGCIPTKMYVYPADLAEATRHSAELGVDAHVDAVRWTDIRDRIFGRIDPIAAGGRDYRAHGENTTLYEARARFTGPHELTLSTGEMVTADQIVVAAGSRATVPDVVRSSGVEFHTSDTVMRIDALPGRIAILGGGFIASEFAHVFAAFGAEVTVIARSGQLLRHLDDDLATRFTEIASRRWDVRLDARITSVSRQAGSIHLDLGVSGTVDADLLLVATGRVPNADLLDPAAAGLTLHPDGRLRVDAHQRTDVDGVWALGDVSSPYMLKHVANHEARVVAHNLAHPQDLIRADHRFVPAAVFTHPQIASVGLTEAGARGAGFDVAVGVEDFSGTAYGWAMEDTTSFCKLIADRESGLLLGAHVIGTQASTLIQPLIQAMSFGQSMRGLARGQYWIHPALTEVVENAILRLELD